MKKLILVLAIFVIVVFSQFSYAKQCSNTLNFNESTVVEPDPQNSARVQINGIWYIVIYNSDGMPIEIIQAPIRS
jgi:hypothetical protein